jgi:riboflavin biosynthesis pyrimidine reductase
VPARRATARPNAGTGAEPPSAAPLAAILANLTARGIGRLFAEGGTMIHTHLTSRRSDLVQYLKSR